jgi:putative transposase
MITLLKWVGNTLLSIFKPRQQLILENLALRQQLAVLNRSSKRPQLTSSDRMFWVLLSKFWNHWAEALHIVQPETVLRWHRQGFRLYWRWKSRGQKHGRPFIDPAIKELIRNMSQANPLWGAPRIHGELLKLDIHISQATVSKYMVRNQGPPSQVWRTFLNNHVLDLASIDFFTVPTATFRVLYVFLVLSHERRSVLHFAVTAHPTAEWTAQQIVEFFPYDRAPRYLMRDRDRIYGREFQQRVARMGIEQVCTAPRSPWQNPYVERLIGSVRRECLDHLIILNESHLHRILRSYLTYYHGSRTHRSLNKDAPEGREKESREMGKIKVVPLVGGLHHRYSRRAA